VIRGAKEVGSIDLTPTWEGILPLLLTGYAEGTPEGQRLAREELSRLARIADANADVTERSAIAVALALLADAIEGGNDHLFPEMTPEQIHLLAERFRP